MILFDQSKPIGRSSTNDALSVFYHYVTSRTGLIAIAAAGLGLGAWLNWGWLVAAGVAPVLISTLPCAAMCALGLCMGKKKGEPANTISSLHDGAPIPSAIETAPEPVAQERTVARKSCC